ncbi:MAG TPA: hypothetical protein VLQ91_13650 [Draconibacterium sp.]|nr:hypothetical protein [Draconibacterium sp.]
MNRTNISLLVVLLGLLMSNCEQPEISDSRPEKNALQDDGERISYLKKSATSNESTQSQQPFELKYASIFNDSTISLQIFYLTTDDYKLHDFDFVWDENLADDSEGKTWMNIEVFHKTYLANAIYKVSDSIKVEIPDLLKFNNKTISKLWLRFINSTDQTNLFTLKYSKIILPGNGSVSQDSSGINGTGNPPIDSLQTGNTPTPGNVGTLPADSTNTSGNNSGSGTGNTPTDSLQTVNTTNPGNGGTLPADSTNTGGNNSGIETGNKSTDSLQTGNTPNPGNGGTLPADSTNTNGTNQGNGTSINPQDSVQTGGTAVNDSLNHTGEVIFNYQDIPAETHFSIFDKELSFVCFNIAENQTRYYISPGKFEKQIVFTKRKYKYRIS